MQQQGSNADSAYEITLIRPSRNSYGLAGVGIESPRVGDTGDVHQIDVNGWVLGDEWHPVTSVNAVIDETLVRRAPVDMPRPDVREAFPASRFAERCGFQVSVGLVGMPEKFELRIEGVFEGLTKNGEPAASPMTVIHGRRQRLRTEHLHTPRLQPIMLTNLGRSGSTLVMRILAEHPAIVAHPLHPYETKAAGYWAHVLHVLTQPANHYESAHPNSYQQNLLSVGQHPHAMPPVTNAAPVARWFGRTYAEEMGAFCQRSGESFYDLAAKSQGRGGAKYFAEKCYPNHTPRVMTELYPHGKEIILVRDFRDVVCSMLDWYRKIGLVSFGREKVGSDVEFIKGESHSAERLLRHWRQRRWRAHLVRYEELILRPVETVRRMMAYLELDLAAGEAEALVRRASDDGVEFRSHRTTSDARDSIGRWRHAEPAIRAACSDTFDDALSEFGYVLDADGSLVFDEDRIAGEPEIQPTRWDA